MQCKNVLCTCYHCFSTYLTSFVSYSCYVVISRTTTLYWSLQVQDCFPYSIGFASDQGPISTLSSHVLFRKGHPFPSVKVLTFLRSSAFHLEAFYADENELPPSAPPKISSFMVHLCIITA